MSIKIRKATKEDMPAVLELVRDLAVYEKAPDEVEVTVEEYLEDGFGENPLFWVIVAEVEGEIAGMAFYYMRYSTWKGKCVYLEDFIVKEKYRRRGIGKLLFDEMIAITKEINARLMVWQVLDWNEPAIEFYKKYNAELDEEWLNGKLEFRKRE